ncbi:MAG: DUF935 domain-containing protein, partial [Nitrospinota bacterium]|nr:DUF935 domain-containing protein [Nitrospinota bacterium]
MARPKKETPEIEELSPANSGGGYDATGFTSELANPDPIQSARGSGLDVYAVVARDDQVKSTWTQRVARVISREWFVEPGGDGPQDQAAADHLQTVIEALDWDRITRSMLFGIFYGYAVAEIMWGHRDGRIVIDDIKVRDRARFSFDRSGGLLFKKSSGQPSLMPDRKFWVFSSGADHGDNPYGLGLAHWLYWPVFFKRGGMKSWLNFLDKFGAPTAKGVFPKGATATEKTKLLEALRAINTDAGIIIPEGMQIELIEAARTGTATYSDLYDRMNSAISKVVLTQTLTTEQGDTGARAMASVHDDMSRLVAKDDADSLMQSFNRTVAVWLTAWNFPSATPPKVWRRMTDEPTPPERADLDKKIFDIGYRPSAGKIEEVYGEGYEPVTG